MATAVSASSMGTAALAVVAVVVWSLLSPSSFLLVPSIVGLVPSLASFVVGLLIFADVAVAGIVVVGPHVLASPGVHAALTKRLVCSVFRRFFTQAARARPALSALRMAKKGTGSGSKRKKKKAATSSNQARYRPTRYCT